MHLPSRRYRLAGGVAAAAAIAMAAAGCASSGSTTTPPTATKLKGGTATMALINGTQPNWIFPFVAPAYYSVYNAFYFYEMMYRPLYEFGNNGNSVTVNYALSPATAPSYSNGGKTVTINMKGWKWSNGESVDAQDLAFWMNIDKYNKANFGGYSPGTMPDNIASYSVPSANTFVLHLKKAYGSTWFTYNQLAEMTPMPLAWDVTKTGAKAGSGGCSATSAWTNGKAACTAVFNFLTAQSKATSSYATSPIWSVVDGPWKLSTYSTTGADTFVPNSSYSGSPKPTISELKYVPYTDTSTEYTALKSGAVDVGFIPSADLPSKPAGAAVPSGSANPLSSAGYTLEPFYSYGISYFEPNWKNPTLGPVFKQLYFRQALQYVNDQEGMIKAIFKGYGVPGTGAVPAKPSNPFLPSIQNANGGAGPYPFSIAKAKSLLTSHGWTMQGGVMTCTTPSKCGAGVKSGTKLNIEMDYSSGSTSMTDMAEAYKSDASKAGINISLKSLTFNSLLGKDNQSSPNWDITMYGGWAYNGPGFLPTGEPLFLCSAVSNFGSYCDPKMDHLINQTLSNGSITTFHNYATYAAQQLPYNWMPNTYAVQAVKSNLKNVTWNPFWLFTPEYWYFVKS